ncbi:transcription/translation regulatory transformer protein RfaH [Stutzerimonas stutzeri]|uniref:transcription/translation regulatory transformer protein RfaH n=1 Tax=Stutzerimonas stutzeri TaxID=316 RepID=UPI0030137729
MDRHIDLPTKAWYLLQCKPRQDARAQEHLARQGFECFAPTVMVQRLSAGKVREQSQPLFPGYVFVRMGTQDSWLSLRSTRGVNRVVSFCGQPCLVQDAIVDQLRQRCATAAPSPVLVSGDRVQVRVGACTEMEAIFLAMDGEERVMLLLNVLNRQHQIQVGLASIEPVRHAATLRVR